MHQNRNGGLSTATESGDSSRYFRARSPEIQHRHAIYSDDDDAPTDSSFIFHKPVPGPVRQNFHSELTRVQPAEFSTTNSRSSSVESIDLRPSYNIRPTFHMVTNGSGLEVGSNENHISRRLIPTNRTSSDLSIEVQDILMSRSRSQNLRELSVHNMPIEQFHQLREETPGPEIEHLAYENSSRIFREETTSVPAIERALREIPKFDEHEVHPISEGNFNFEPFIDQVATDRDQFSPIYNDGEFAILKDKDNSEFDRFAFDEADSIWPEIRQLPRDNFITRSEAHRSEFNRISFDESVLIPPEILQTPNENVSYRIIDSQINSNEDELELSHMSINSRVYHEAAVESLNIELDSLSLSDNRMGCAIPNYDRSIIENYSYNDHRSSSIYQQDCSSHRNYYNVAPTCNQNSSFIAECEGFYARLNSQTTEYPANSNEQYELCSSSYNCKSYNNHYSNINSEYQYEYSGLISENHQYAYD